MGGSGRSKNIKKRMKLYQNFQRGGEVLKKIPSEGEVWIFSGTTHSVFASVAYDPAKTRLLESEAEVEEPTNHKA